MKPIAVGLALCLGSGAHAACEGAVIFACGFQSGQQSIEVCLTGDTVEVFGTGQDMALASGRFGIAGVSFSRIAEGGRVVRDELGWTNGGQSLFLIQTEGVAGLVALDPAGVPVDFVCDRGSDKRGGFDLLATRLAASGYSACADEVWRRTCP